MMKLSDMAERQIRKAQAEGRFDNLKGAGKPLNMAGDGGAEAIGFRIMAKAGAVPREIQLRKPVEAQTRILSLAADGEARQPAMEVLADVRYRAGSAPARPWLPRGAQRQTAACPARRSFAKPDLSGGVAGTASCAGGGGCPWRDTPIPGGAVTHYRRAAIAGGAGSVAVAASMAATATPPHTSASDLPET